MATRTSVRPRPEQSPAPDLVVSLRDAAAAEVARTGGKGANLAALLAAGFAVPPGFVITATAYRQAADGRLGPPAEVPADLAERIAAAYDELGGGPVAVRSSATSEDLAGAAFAGQHDTVLHVVGAEPLLAAVLRCWGSLWSAHAVDYRRRAGLDTPDVAMAVVVQRMVEADAAGVMFTADPVTGARDRMTVDATPGLGEALVSGQVTGDHYVLDKRSGAVLASGASQPHGVLDAGQLAELARIGRAVETVFGAPQDIEWARQGHQVYLVQARPMTALPDAPAPAAPPSRAQRFFLRILGDMMPFRPYPMDATLWVPAAYAGVRDFMSAAGVRWRGTGQMFVEREGVVHHLDPAAPAVSPLSPLKVLANVVRGQPYTRECFLADPEVRRVRDEIEILRELDLRHLPFPALAAPLRTAVTATPVLLGRRKPYMGRSGLRVARLAVVLALLGRTRLLAGLLSGADTKTTEANRDLERLAARVRTSPELTAAFAGAAPADLPAMLEVSPAGRAFLAEHAAFLAEHGHREGALLLVSQPCWADDPAATLGVVQALARTAPPSTGTAPTSAEGELLQHPLVRRGPLRSRVLRWLAAARTLTQFREDTHYYATLGMPLVRRVLLEYGRRLREVGVLSRPEEVFHLRAGELDLEWPPDAATAARLHEVVRRRIAVRAGLAHEPWLPVEGGAAPQDALLVGIAASAGRVSGPVRVIASPADFGTLRSGEVLVAPFTNPSWTPLFAVAAAVVVDTGSPASHAAIVAREYGIPAVIGTRTATTTLTDGQPVVVDGTRGLVLEASAGEP